MLLIDALKKKRWSPWIAGGLLGVTAVACYAIAEKTLGASGGFESMASILGSSFHLSWANSIYFRLVKPPEVSFQMVQFIGMFFGALIASFYSRDLKIRMIPDQEWVQRFGPSKVKRWILIFLGGVIIEFAAGIAGGCTSGLGISGTIQLSPAGLIFIVGVFTSGILMTKILYGRNYR
ncbi:MAG: YeeE/YedE family protein [Dehalobacter sp.]|nr:YeeE/YedE family protein [Dehalobacter sp.]